MAIGSLALLLGPLIRAVVLPFDNLSQEASPDWRGSVFEEAISSHFVAAGLDVVDVLDRNRHLDEVGIVPGDPITRATAIVIARELDAERVVMGTYVSSGDELEVEARLVDLNRGATVGIVEDFGAVGDLGPLASLVAKNLLRLEGGAVPPGFDEVAKRRAVIPLTALEAGARARVALDSAEQRQHLNRALELSGSYLEARFLLGRLLIREGLTREAIDVLAEARGTDELYRAAYFELGLAYLEVNEVESAQLVFQSLAETESRAATFNNLGAAQMRASRFDEATAAFEKACGLGGEAAISGFNLGWSHWRSGRGAEALEQMSEVVAGRPFDAEAWLVHSAAALSQARPEEAKRSRVTAEILAPHLVGVDPATVVGWERTLERNGAGSSPGAVPPLSDQSLESMAALLDARTLRSRGRVEDAIQLLQKALYVEPSAGGLRRELAELHHEVGDLDSAASELSILVWAEPSVEAHIDLARLYLQMGEPKRALDQVERALEIDPESSDAHRLHDAIAVP
ncbi:MAG TPA: FlgO family outer membrane protein [Vicinamibacteria bacterium]|nr:FlgO family outer membrane protein [Vicinamibacteria bacterium]